MRHTSVGSLIVRYRMAAGLTQMQLAEKANLAHASIQKLEQGVKDDPRLSTVQSIANALKIRMLDLLPDGHEGADLGKSPPPQPTSTWPTKETIGPPMS